METNRHIRRDCGPGSTDRQVCDYPGLGGIVAWVATPADIKDAEEGDILRIVRGPEPHEHILASGRTSVRPSAACVLLIGRPVPKLDGFTAPPGELWRSYVTALTSAALRR